MSSLAGWANVPPPPDREWSQAEKIAHLQRWQPALAIRQKLVANFRPKGGETDVFIYATSGERLAYPSCNVETLLTAEECDLLASTTDEEDPILELLNEGWRAALNWVAEGRSDVSPLDDSFFEAGDEEDDVYNPRPPFHIAVRINTDGNLSN